MEKRRHVRQPLDLNAWITLEGGARHGCQIKDFSLSGVFIACGGLKDGASAGPAPADLENKAVAVEFSAESPQGEQPYRLTGRLARVLEDGIGVEFVNPDPATLLVMQELANKAHKSFLEAQGEETARNGAAPDASAGAVADRLGILEILKELVDGFLTEGLQALYVEAREGLFEAAKKASNPVKETECFDALKELDNIRSLVEQSFVETVLKHVMQPGYAQLAGPEAPQQSDGELTLVDAEKFQDWLRMKRILEKAGPRFKDNQYELLERLSVVSNTKIDEFNNPIGLLEICGSYYDSVQELGASRITRETIFDALENTVVAKLGMLHSEVNSLLVSNGILPTVEPPKHVVKKIPRSKTPEKEQPAAPVPGHAYGGPAPTHTETPPPGPAGAGTAPAAGPAAHSGGGTSASLRPVAVNAGAAPGAPPPGASAAPVHSAAASGQAAQGAAAALEPAGDAANPSDTSSMRVVSGRAQSAPGRHRGAAGAPGASPRPDGSAYQAVHTLLGLQRGTGLSGGQSGFGTASGGGNFAAAESAGSAYARDEIVSALSSVRDLTGSGGAPGGVNLKQHIHSALQSQQPPGVSKQLGQAEDAAIDLTSGLVESMVEDVLVSDEIKSQFKNLEIPLLKAAMKNETFFADPEHPARRVVDQLGELSIPKGELGSKLRSKVDQIVNEIASKEGDGESEFAGAVNQLDSLLKEQMASYENNVRGVVEDCERQEQMLQSLKKNKPAEGADADEAGTTSRREVPAELRQWLERAGRIQVGDRVAIDTGGRTHREILAWVSGDKDKYVFVDDVGAKASSMIRQQLAMLLKRGLLRVLEETAVPAMERGMHMIMRKLHDDLANKAIRDATTGLLNEKAFLEQVDRAISNATQTSSEHVLCYLDIDNFGEINEKWDEATGDKLLKRFGIVLNKNVGDKGVTARLPGDEFGLVLYGCSGEKGFEFADRLRRAIASARCYWKGESLPLSVSIGIASITKECESVDKLMETARDACKKAKDAGRDRVEVAKDEPQKATAWPLKHNTMVVDKILEGDRLQLQAQKVEPIGSDADSKPYYEILLGLRSIGGDLVSPDSFLRAAERSNQVTQVDRWVIRKALEWMSKNKRRLLKLGGFAINLSPLSLNDDTLTRYVMDQFMETKVPPGKVIFEVKETAAIERLSTAEEFLRVMRDFGCRFALDDFGAGQSSYDYLQQLAVDFVKIDGMFVRELETNLSDYAMVKSVTEIGRFMGKKTVADSVDSDVVLNKLKEIGVDYVQGALVESPVPLQDLH